MSTTLPATPDIEYPDSDGEPMAENTRQAHYIATVKGGLEVVFRAAAAVFIAMDNLWYPVQGHPDIRMAPDVYVAFGRPKGDRGSYKQWEEGDVPLTVVVEILSPGNRAGKMAEKFEFYRKYGVEEYYIYDPDDGELFGYRRDGDELIAVTDMQDFVSPRLGVRFHLRRDGELDVYGPDGERFLDHVEWHARAEAERQGRDAERQGRDAERQGRDAERQRAEAERQGREAERQRAEALAALLRAHGIEPPA